MAITENFIPGNGGNTYNFSFPYLKTEDVRVELQEYDPAQPEGNQVISVDDTAAFTIDPLNPTQIEFSAIGADTVYQTAPDGDVKVTSTNGKAVRVRIYRVTPPDSTPATFFSGSAIRAQDLNGNFEQTLYIIQEKENQLTNIKTEYIQEGAISTDLLQDDSVTAAKLRDSASVDGDRAVTTNHIRDNAVTTAKINNLAVTTDKINNLAVTTAKIDDQAVTSSKIANLTIVDYDINGAAAISHSKLANITAGSVLLGNASNVPTATAFSGDVTINSSGVTSISPGVIVNSDISASAEIAVSKLADGSARQLLQTDAAGTGVEWTDNVDIPGTLDVTGATTLDSTLTIPSGSVGTPSIGFFGDSNTGIYSPGADQIALVTAGTGRLFVNSTGTIQTNSAGQIESWSSAGSLTLYGGATSKGGGIKLNGGVADGNIIFYAQQQTATPAERLRITSTGALNFVGAGTLNSLAVSFSGSAPSNSLVVDYAGHILIGTASNSGGAPLQVNGDRIRVATAKTPASVSDTGTTGEICWDSNYVYVCVATNTWKRSALSSWP
jgi:hypothetical protein